MDDKVRINLPKEPIVLGDAADGKPIWVDPKDFILDGDQKLEQGDNMLKSQFNEAIRQASLQMAARVECWLQETFMKLAPDWANTMDKLQEWVKGQDFSFIESGKNGERHIILRRGDKVVSEFKATLKTK